MQDRSFVSKRTRSYLLQDKNEYDRIFQRDNYLKEII